MKTCWCTLAGTKHCQYCNNNGNYTGNFLDYYAKNLWKKYPYKYYTNTTKSTIKMNNKQNENNDTIKKFKLIKQFKELDTDNDYSDEIQSILLKLLNEIITNQTYTYHQNKCKND